MDRRKFLRTGGAVGVAALAGCLETLGFEEQSAWRDPPLVENRPDAVYYPAIVEEMEMYGMTESGDYGVVLMYSFPHRFWNVTGTTSNKVVVEAEDTLHLMLSLWDAETETVLPVDSTVELSLDGEVVTSFSPWPMLSQSMGFHYGDNVTLPEEGTYTAAIRAGPVAANRTGEFADRFEEPLSAELAFEYVQDDVYDLGFHRLEDKQGDRGAVEPMAGHAPTGRAPNPADLPGKVLGEGESGDARFVVAAVEAERFGEGTYLAVSPRTPYNGYSLPLMSLSATLSRDGETVFDGALREGLDSTLGYHYGASVEGVEPGDELTISVDSPPQVARHDGYETAFVEMDDVELDL